MTFPAPEFSICIDLPPAHAEGSVDLSALPAKPGVFVLEDAHGGTLALATTANLRRMVTSKLSFIPEDAKPSRRIDYRTLVRRVLAVRVGSSFEADWAYLQCARKRLPATYRSLLDRWQAWFVHCNPRAPFPQWVKTAHPRIVSGDDVFVGPMPDKHVAGQYIEMLQDAFDLCRYHHLLVQAPHATACAYKEMGRCPAPCDGSISMDTYRQQLHDAIEFACTPIDQWRDRVERAMRSASDNLDFESAQRRRHLLDRTALAAKAECKHVDRLEQFVFFAIMPGESATQARMFLIRGGWIERVADVAIKSTELQRAELAAVIDSAHSLAKPQAADFSDAGIENIGMTCWHLFRPRSARTGMFIRIDQDLNIDSVNRALKQLNRRTRTNDEEPAIADHDLESPTAPDSSVE